MFKLEMKRLLKSSSCFAKLKPRTNFMMYNKNLTFMSFSNTEYNMIKTSQPQERVALIQLYRPKAKNALCNELMGELNLALSKFDEDPNIASIVLTGDVEYFAAGADIKEMKDKTFSDVYKSHFLSHWDYITKVKKPVIGAVNGFALGGGCELAMMCDILIAGNNALFGQPEINLGTIPGAGGTQRLTRIIGKSRAMEMVLTGESMKAEEALLRGLVSRVVDKEKSVEEALNVASKIASKGIITSMACKDSVNKAYETSLSQGLEYEKRLFWSTFATEDRKLGMTNFVNKVRKFKFTDN